MTAPFAHIPGVSYPPPATKRKARTSATTFSRAQAYTRWQRAVDVAKESFANLQKAEREYIAACGRKPLREAIPVSTPPTHNP